MAETSYILKAKGHNQAAAKGTIIKIKIPGNNGYSLFRVLKLDGNYAKLLLIDQKTYPYGGITGTNWSNQGNYKTLSYWVNPVTSAYEYDATTFSLYSLDGPPQRTPPATWAERIYDDMNAALKPYIKTETLPNLCGYYLDTNANHQTPPEGTVLTIKNVNTASGICHLIPISQATPIDGNDHCTAHILPLQISDVTDYFGKNILELSDLKQLFKSSGDTSASIYATAPYWNGTSDVWMWSLDTYYGFSYSGGFKLCFWLDLSSFRDWETYQ